MNRFCFLSFLLILNLIFAAPALAHRVHLFAYVEQGEIVVDSRFSKARPVQNGTIDIVEAESGKPLLQGTSDSQGAARFAIPAEIIQQPVDLRLTIKAGEGHQGEWLLPAAELSGQAAVAQSAQSADATESTPPPPANTTGAMQSAPALATASNAAPGQEVLTAQDVEAIINRSLEAKLNPIKAMLAAQQAKEPGFIEIIGGIGWIFGLFALLLLWKKRKKAE